MIEEVVVFALEALVRFLLNLENDVSRLRSWHLVALPRKVDALPILHTLVDRHVQDFALRQRLLAHAGLATVAFADNLALAATVWARCLESLNHWAHLPHHQFDANAVAPSALLHRALLATTTVACFADDAALQCQLRDFAAVDVLERHPMFVHDCLDLWRTLRRTHTTTTTKHATESTEAAAAAAEEL